MVSAAPTSGSAREALTGRFGMLNAVALGAAAAIIPLFRWLGSVNGHKAWPFYVVPLYTLAVALFTLALAASYWRSREWHYMWRNAMARVHAEMPPQQEHGRGAFLAERGLLISCLACTLSAVIITAVGTGALSWPALVVAPLALLIVLAAMVRDSVGSIRAQFRRDDRSTRA